MPQSQVLRDSVRDSGPYHWGFTGGSWCREVNLGIEVGRIDFGKLGTQVLPSLPLKQEV